MVVGPTAPHGMEGCAALLDKRRASGAATFLSDRDRAGPGSEQSSSCSREGRAKWEQRAERSFQGGGEAGAGRLEEGTWVEKEPPWWWCASLLAARGAGSTNNYLTISEPGNKQSLASTTTTKEMTTPKSKT